MLRELISQVDCTASFRDIQQIGHMKKKSYEECCYGFKVDGLAITGEPSPMELTAL